MIFIIYKKLTGEILRIISTDQDPKAQLAEGEDYIQGSANDITHWVKDSKLVYRGKPPSKYHKFNYETETWEDPRSQEQQLQEAWQPVIQQRNELLAATDWRVIRAQETGEPETEAWKQYRQQLRDITKQIDPLNITWPQRPQ